MFQIVWWVASVWRVTKSQKVSCAGRQLRPRRQQHPGLLHPGRHQVPRRHPRRQAAPGPRDPAGAERRTTRSGTSSRCTPRPAPHADVDHVRPRRSRARTGRWRASASTPSGSSTPTGETSLVKFHWKPRARRALAGLGGGADCSAASTPTSTAATSTTPSSPAPSRSGSSASRSSPDTADQTFEGIDLLDPTKLVPEELAPVQPIGLLTLTGNPTNFFAETEQVAFHVGHLVPGHRRHRRPAAAGAAVLLPRHPAHPARRPELRPDPDQPAARAGQRHAPRRVPPARRCTAGSRRTGRTRSTAAARSSPAHDDGGFVDVPRPVAGAPRCASRPRRSTTTSARPRLFWLSMTPVEQDHIVDAYTFELGKCYEQAIQERAARRAGQHRRRACAREVAAGLGLPAPEPPELVEPTSPQPRAVAGRATPWPADGRTVGDRRRRRRPTLDGVATLRTALAAERLVPLVIAPHGGSWSGGLPSSADLRHRPVGRVRRRPRRARRARRPAPASCCCRRLPARQGDRLLGRRGRDLAGAGITRTPWAWSPARASAKLAAG